MNKITILLAMFLLSTFATMRAQDNTPTYIEGDPIMLDTPQDLGDNYGNDVVLPKKYFGEVKVGDKIRLLLSDVKAGAQIEIYFKFNNSAWTWTTYISYVDIPEGAEMYELVLDDKVVDGNTVTATDFIDGLQVRDGMHIKGKNAFVTGLQILSYDDGTDPYADYVIGDLVEFDHTVTWGDFSINEKYFNRIKIGDKIRLLFTEVGDNPQLQFAIKQDNSSWTWTDFLLTAVRGTKYELEVTGYTYKKKELSAELILAGLKAHGLWLKGQQSKLIGMQILTHKDNVEYFMYGGCNMLEAPADLNSWKNEVQFGKEFFGFIRDNDLIDVYLSDKKAGAQVQFAGKKHLENNGWSTFVKYQDVIMDDYIEFPVKAYTTDENGAFTGDEVADALRVDGMYLKGKSASVTGMQILYRLDPNDETVWDEVSSTLIGRPLSSLSSSPMFLAGNTRFKKAQLGDKFVLYIRKNNLGDNHQYRITANDDNMEITGIQNFQSENIEILIDSENLLSLLKSKGLNVYGVNVDYDGFTLLRKSQTGIDDIFTDKLEGIDFTQPYEIYTVMGVRVSEMTPGAVYIIRQGTNVVKMVK